MEAQLIPPCIKCNNPQNVIPIVYGRPAPQAIEDAQNGKIKLSGCGMAPETHHCKTCNFDFEATYQKH